MGQVISPEEPAGTARLRLPIRSPVPLPFTVWAEAAAVARPGLRVAVRSAAAVVGPQELGRPAPGTMLFPAVFRHLERHFTPEVAELAEATGPLELPFTRPSGVAVAVAGSEMTEQTVNPVVAVCTAEAVVVLAVS